MFKADAFDGAGQEIIAHWGSKAFIGKSFGDLSVRIALVREQENLLF
jgi:hypothetical protein